MSPPSMKLADVGQAILVITGLYWHLSNVKSLPFDINNTHADSLEETVAVAAHHHSAT